MNSSNLFDSTMKQLNFTFLLIIIISSTLFGQLDGNYELEFDNQWGMEHLFIDTISNENNIWQVGQPQKSIFSSAYSSPNVIITDSIHSYPPNDTSSFIITNQAGAGFYVPHTVVLAFKYYVNSDTLTDYGKIEFSPDNGTTWIDMLDDAIWFYYWPFYEKPVLSGNSNGWKNFYINLAQFGYDYGVQYGDTVLYRFTFISDSIQTNKDGLMFDSFSFWDYSEGIDEVVFGIFTSYCFPNPANNNLTIKFENRFNIIDITIFDIHGKSVFEKQISNENTVELNISELTSGIYFYKLINHEEKIFSTGRFLKE